MKKQAPKSRYMVQELPNPIRRVNEVFPAYENLRHPRVQELRRKYRLDAVVAGETDEFRRILLLRQWIKSQIAINDANPAPARDDAFSILDAARADGGFHCAHFSLVQQAVLNAFGYVTRRLGAGPGLNDPKFWGHHGINEVWVNDLCKWVLTDAKYDLHFEKDGLPLSALEIRDELLADGGVNVQRAYGPDRAPARGKTPGRPDTYRWISWEVTPYFTDFPNQGSSALITYEDEYARNHTWYRDNAPHWAYAADYFLPVRHRGWIEWTPNVISSRVTIEGDRAQIRLYSCTPNLHSYQLQRAQGEWRDCKDDLNLKLGPKGLHLTFRTLNLAQVPGPEHQVAILPT
jgi:hypothetical protein